MSLLDDLRVDIGDDGAGGLSQALQDSCLCTDSSGVTGPDSSIDQGIARFVGTDGSTIEGSLATLDDSGNITTPGGATLGGDLCLQDSVNFSQRIVTASGDVQMLESDTILWLNKTTGEPTTVTLPTSPKLGRVVYVKDMKGDADTNFITVAMSGGTIDGMPQFIMSNNYQSLTFAYNGTEWNII